MKLLVKSLGLVENNALAHIKRGNMYRKDSNFMMAENDYTGALEIDSNNLQALKARVELYKATQREEEAEQDIQRISELTKIQTRSEILLTPIMSKMSAEEVETDIQAKIK